MNKKAETWLDPKLYPFENKYLELEAGRMHYIDEGQGEILLFVHGTPTWSFLYRNLIKDLSSSYRCIAIDHLGFGLSEASEEFSGTPEAHAKNLSQFIKSLKLKEITLIVHDFGGPIGLAAGIEHQEKIKKVVLLNSWLWETKNNAEALKVDKIVNNWLGKFLYLNMNFSPKVLLKKVFFDKTKLSKKIHQHYIKPFPNKKSRIPLLNIAKALVGSSDWYQEQWLQLDQLANRDWLILWGNEDQFITTAYLDKWRERLPNATIKQLDSGHFVQEEKPKESIAEIRNFMRN